MFIEVGVKEGMLFKHITWRAGSVSDRRTTEIAMFQIEDEIHAELHDR